MIRAILMSMSNSPATTWRLPPGRRLRRTNQ